MKIAIVPMLGKAICPTGRRTDSDQIGGVIADEASLVQLLVGRLRDRGSPPERIAQECLLKGDDRCSVRQMLL